VSIWAHWNGHLVINWNFLLFSPTKGLYTYHFPFSDFHFMITAENSPFWGTRGIFVFFYLSTTKVGARTFDKMSVLLPSRSSNYGTYTLHIGFCTLLLVLTGTEAWPMASCVSALCWDTAYIGYLLAGCTTKPPCDKTPFTRLNFGWRFNSSERDTSGHIFKYRLPTQKDVINGHFVRHKQTGNEIYSSISAWTCVQFIYWIVIIHLAFLCDLIYIIYTLSRCFAALSAASPSASIRHERLILPAR